MNNIVKENRKQNFLSLVRFFISSSRSSTILSLRTRNPKFSDTNEDLIKLRRLSQSIVESIDSTSSFVHHNVVLMCHFTKGRCGLKGRGIMEDTPYITYRF